MYVYVRYRLTSAARSSFDVVLLVLECEIMEFSTGLVARLLVVDFSSPLAMRLGALVCSSRDVGGCDIPWSRRMSGFVAVMSPISCDMLFVSYFPSYATDWS